MNHTEFIKIALTGDSFITQRIPKNEPYLNEIRQFLAEFDMRFTNFEVTVHNFEQSPSATSGGTWAAARPYVLKDLGWLGFNTLACATNHSLDWLHGGLLSTMNYLDEYEGVYAGIGRNLAEASQPKYLETRNGRIAIISVTATFENWHRAGEQRSDVSGRPGVNPLGHKMVHKVKAEHLENLREIDAYTEINAARNLNIHEGFIGKTNEQFVFGNHQFEIGEPGTTTEMDQEDARRMARAIKEASRQADAVFISIHSHEMKEGQKNRPADFIKRFSRFCIDEGAHAVIGHGPHILQGIEIYHNRPIFYSLGNFIFQNETVEKQPVEFYDLYQLDNSHTTADGFDQRSQNGVRGLAANPKVYESIIASFTFGNGSISAIELRPITLGFDLNRPRKGKPRFADDRQSERILAELNELSSEFGTTIKIKDAKGYIDL